MTKRKVGLLVMSYGSPKSEEDVERYYTHILNGRAPRPEMVSNLVERYRIIGGISPLGKITQDQIKALTNDLNQKQSNIEWVPFHGQKHTAPFVEDAVRSMHKAGITEAVSIVLAPHYSLMSIKTYHDRAQEIAQELGNLTLYSIDSWYQEKMFIQYWSEAVLEKWGNLTADEKQTAVVLFTAHSLPEKIKQMGDPYEEQICETAKLIANQAGIVNYETSWQSAGGSREPWLGPDVQEYTKQLSLEKGYKTFIYAPVGFVADHLEVLFDNDYECQNVCDEIQAKYIRVNMPNSNGLFIQAMAEAVVKKLQS
ncbi:MAG: ferrochelatase [Bacillales bacterium]|jgi:ferrochelatase|nr:ferrochelatase [Bacillales bacterium]